MRRAASPFTRRRATSAPRSICAARRCACWARSTCIRAIPKSSSLKPSRCRSSRRPISIDPAPLPFSTHDAALEANQGWLTQITGTVTARIGESIFVDDGSGPVRAFLDGYNGTWDDIHVLDQVTVKGLISEDGDGQRASACATTACTSLIPDDVTILAAGLNFSGSTATVDADCGQGR